MDLLEFSSKFIMGETDALSTFCRLFTENNILYFMLAPYGCLGNKIVKSDLCEDSVAVTIFGNKSNIDAFKSIETDYNGKVINRHNMNIAISCVCHKPTEIQMVFSRV